VITPAAMERDLVIVACAISAGIHAALVPGHLKEGAAAGTGFAAAAVMLMAVAIALTWVANTSAIAGAATLFGGLLVSYGLAVTTGLPLLHPHPEAIDGLALFTKAVELTGLISASHLLLRQRSALSLTFPRTKGTLA